MPALYGGYKDDFLSIVKQNKEIFKNQNISKIITNCPACCRIFCQEYGIKAEHIAQLVLRNIGKIKKDYGGEKVSYHDPCELGRKLLVYEEPREILRHIGFEVIELKNNRENALCCGAGGLLKENSPKVANRIALLRLKEVKTKKLITTCPLCYKHLKDNASGSGVQVMELSEVLI